VYYVILWFPVSCIVCTGFSFNLWISSLGDCRYSESLWKCREKVTILIFILTFFSEWSEFYFQARTIAHTLWTIWVHLIVISVNSQWIFRKHILCRVHVTNEFGSEQIACLIAFYLSYLKAKCNIEVLLYLIQKKSLVWRNESPL
jgi:hypothetical protein